MRQGCGRGALSRVGKEKPRTRGDAGASPVPFGGNLVMGGGKNPPLLLK